MSESINPETDEDETLHPPEPMCASISQYIFGIHSPHSDARILHSQAMVSNPPFFKYPPLRKNISRWHQEVSIRALFTLLR